MFLELVSVISACALQLVRTSRLRARRPTGMLREGETAFRGSDIDWVLEFRHSLLFPPHKIPESKLLLGFVYLASQLLKSLIGARLIEPEEQACGIQSIEHYDGCSPATRCLTE